MQFLGRLRGRKGSEGKEKIKKRSKKDMEVGMYREGTKYERIISALHILDPVTTIETPTRPKSF